MSYTRPSPSAADATWSGAGVYTRPDPADADAAFAAFVAEGFRPISFGAPRLAPVHPVGWKAPTFGTPLYVGPQFVQASGFRPVNAGTPNAGGYSQASGALHTNFGTPAVAKTTVGWKATNFGSPRLAVIATGWKATTFGTPAMKQLRLASGFRPITFGTSYSADEEVVLAAGFRAANCGDHVALKYATVP